jgi:hypothetical protein
MLRSVAITWAVLSLLLVAFCYLEVSDMGWPDGHMTAYERSIATPLKILAVACFVQALWFLFVGILCKEVRVLPLWLGIMITAVIIVAPILASPICPDVELCRDVYRQVTGMYMDDGEGG